MSFFVELWDSVWTPGTTPTLVRAMHGSFISLTAVLLGMLIATRSLHFVALLTLEFGLWMAITWFIKEANKAKVQEKRREFLAQQAAGATGSASGVPEASTAYRRS